MEAMWLLRVGLLGCVMSGVCGHGGAPMVTPRVIINAEEVFLQTGVDSFGLYDGVRPEPVGKEYSEPDPLTDGSQSL